MAKVVFLVFSAILAYASAEYPLPHSFYLPPPPKPHSVYGVPDIYKPIVSEPQPIAINFLQKPTIHDVPKLDAVPDLSYIVPGIQHHGVIHPEIPSKPIVSHYNYKLPEHVQVVPSKFEVPIHHPHPAPVYGVPKVL